MREELLTLKQINIEYPQFSTQKLSASIRKGELKAVKRGLSYYVTRQNLNTYLGINNSNTDINKDLEIARLKQELNKYKTELNTIKGLIGTCSAILG